MNIRKAWKVLWEDEKKLRYDRHTGQIMCGELEQPYLIDFTRGYQGSFGNHTIGGMEGSIPMSPREMNGLIERLENRKKYNKHITF